jgi:hypothetical protein
MSCLALLAEAATLELETISTAAAAVAPEAATLELETISTAAAAVAVCMAGTSAGTADSADADDDPPALVCIHCCRQS